MASRFDPSAFIEAEDSQALARPASVLAPAATVSETAEISHFQTPAEPTLATIATLAWGPLANTPWADEITSFIARPKPSWIPGEHWDELVGEVENIEAGWGEKAHAAGWDVIDLYGCPPEPLARRYGQSGLVHTIVSLLTPVTLKALTGSGAILQPYQGAAMTYRPAATRDAVPIWKAYSAENGP